jgi:hypothetical protein
MAWHQGPFGAMVAAIAVTAATRRAPVARGRVRRQLSLPEAGQDLTRLETTDSVASLSLLRAIARHSSSVMFALAS